MSEHWIRTCQECGHKQHSVEPPTNERAWAKFIDAKCRRCKSMALDYGKLSGPVQDDEWEA